ncbi:MAG: tRNA pseudouridine(55) synthase TruB [Clostridia bacterium]|nr:tRNA pseudouridine(55) synthase TruB [Clostridia bacterium]MBR2953314.1 tRNA pseudouridine(55) synthase TruB [Clostridia bacterium]MBR2953351.1 tRNA pseudouridine(55) synthase TruB [Clostridia bacterium]
MTGIICLDKPKGMSSFMAVKRASRILGVKKAGHTGTLDPMATGVLVIMLGHSTRFIELLPEHKKSYTARVKLGITTDTLDITGEVLTQSPVSVTEEQLLSVANGFKGDILQTPPMYSALKKDGERLYDLARKGIEVTREQRQITIEQLDIYDFDGVEFSMDVICSAGTYIRSLCDDIGRKLGCGAVMTELRRTSANGFSIETAVTLEELETLVNENSIESALTTVEKALLSYNEITVTKPQANRFHNGGGLAYDRLHGNYPIGIYRVYSPERKLLGLGEIKEEKGDLEVRRVLVSDE